MAKTLSRNKGVSRVHQMFHSRSLQNERLRDKAIKIRMFLDRGIYEDCDGEKYCPNCQTYYDNDMEFCPLCSNTDFDENDGFQEDEWDDDREDFHDRLQESFDPFAFLKMPERDIKELLKKELYKFFIAKKIDKDKSQKLSDCIIKNLYKYSDHMIMVFHPSLVTELCKIKSFIEGISDSYYPGLLPYPGKNTFPLAGKEILSSSLKGFSSSIPSFPSLSDILSIRKALELEPFHNITEILTRISGLKSDFDVESCHPNSCFKEFLENIEKKIPGFSYTISSTLLKKSEVEHIKHFLDLLLEWYRSYKIALHYKEKEKTGNEDKSLEELIRDLAHDYTIEDFISGNRDGFMCFDEHIEKVCQDISNIFLRVREGTGINQEEALAIALKNYYILCISMTAECSREIVEKSMKFIKNLAMNKRRLREYLSADIKTGAGIIIEKKGEDLFVNIPSYIPEHIKIKDHITGKDREEARILLDSYIRKTDTMRIIGEFLINTMPSVFKAQKDIKKEIYKFIAGIYQDRKESKGRKITVEQLLIEQKSVDKYELSRIFNSESLLFPSGDELPLKNLLYTKADILDDIFPHISSWVISMQDKECAEKVNEYFCFGKDFIISSDIRNLRHRQNNPEFRKTRGKKKKVQ